MPFCDNCFKLNAGPASAAHACLELLRIYPRRPGSPPNALERRTYRCFYCQAIWVRETPAGGGTDGWLLISRPITRPGAGAGAPRAPVHRLQR